MGRYQRSFSKDTKERCIDQYYQKCSVLMVSWAQVDSHAQRAPTPVDQSAYGCRDPVTAVPAVRITKAQIDALYGIRCFTFRIDAQHCPHEEELVKPTFPF